MRIELENIGMWRSAGLTIDGITVIAGENGTGKSTFSKALFVVFNTLNQLDRHVQEARRTMAQKAVRDMFSEVPEADRLACRRFWSDVSVERLLDDDLERVLKDLDYLRDDLRQEVIDKLGAVKSITDDQVCRGLMSTHLAREFDDQAQNLESRKNKETAAIRLTIAKELTEVTIRHEVVATIQNRRSLKVQPIYLDDVAMLAALLSSRSAYPETMKNGIPWHVAEMAKLIGGASAASRGSDEENVFATLLQAQAYEPVRKRLEALRCGYLKAISDGFKVVDAEDASVQHSLVNVAAGLKPLLILEDLVLNQTIKEKGLLLWDEPEAHLHPEWQLILAELIVLLQKTFKLHVLVASHSPYFISALDAYSKKYQVAEHNHYYLTERKGKELALTDVTKRIAMIYNSLARPYQAIEDVERSVDGCKSS